MLSFESLDSIFDRAAEPPAEAATAVVGTLVIGVTLVVLELLLLLLLLLGQVTEMLLLLASEGFPADTGFTVIFILSPGITC